MGNVERIDISKDLALEVSWTEEETPQLESVKIIQIIGGNQASTVVNEEDVLELSYQLSYIHRNSLLQKQIKDRKMRK